MARRTLNRRELRAANEAAEARERERKREEEEDEDEDEDEEDDEENEDEELDVDADDIGDDSSDSDDEDEEAPKKKKKKAAKPKAAKAPSKRTRAAKHQRLRKVWTVFNNSHQPVAKFDYPKKDEAYALAAKLTADKKSTHFVQDVNEPMEDKPESK